MERNGDTEGREASSSTVGGTDELYIVVVGDNGTGKSSLISTQTKKLRHTQGRSVLDDTYFPSSFTPYGAPFTVLDTSLKKKEDMEDKMKKAKAIVITYACDQPKTFKRLTTFWLPKLVKLRLQKVPVVVIGCKIDLCKENEELWDHLDLSFSRLMEEFQSEDIDLDSGTICSARRNKVRHVFSYPVRAVLYPVRPLFDPVRMTMTFRLVRALKRVFHIADKDKDNALSDKEIKAIQEMYSPIPMGDKILRQMKLAIKEYLPQGVTPSGAITLSGFLFLHGDYLQKACYEATWKTVRAYGYGDDLKYRDDLFQDSFVRLPGQSVELTDKARQFLKEFFWSFHLDQGVLPAADVDHLLLVELDSRYKDEVEVTASGGLSLDSFLCMWDLLVLREPAKAMARLIDIGYWGPYVSALRVTIERKIWYPKQEVDKNVLQCFVFGSKKTGKSSLLDYFIGRKVSGSYSSTSAQRFAANGVDRNKGTKKTLILREIPENDETMLISEKHLGACDVAIFLYDSSVEGSWEKAKELATRVTFCAEKNNFLVPCYFIVVNNDPSLQVNENCWFVSSSYTTLQLFKAHMVISITEENLNDIFSKLVDAFEFSNRARPRKKAYEMNKIVQPPSDCSLVSLLNSRVLRSCWKRKL